MADDIPEIVRGLGDGGEPLVMVGERGEEARDMGQLLRLVPSLAASAHAGALARAANHLAHANTYDVIEDPEAFAAEYKARLAREDPAAPWQEGVIRLCDHGVPDFAAVAPPAFARGRLRFCAVDRFLGLPYLAETAELAVPPTYTPMPLTPVPRPEGPPPPMDPGLDTSPAPPPEIRNVADFQDPGA